MIKGGADVNAQNNRGDTVLIWATDNQNNDNQFEIVKLLLNAGADVNVKSGIGAKTALMDTAGSMTDRSEVVKLLIDAGADINAKDEFGTTALMEAARYSTPKVVKLLIDSGADVNIKSRNGTTALISAAHGDDRLEVMKLLLKAGADINAKDRDGKTALDYSKNDEVKKLLLNYKK